MAHPRQIFFAFDEQGGREPIPLPPAEAHHLRNVLRLPVGSLLTVVHPESRRVYEALIAEREEGVSISIVRERPGSRPMNIVKTLLFALSKGKKNDFVCEKAGELGIEKIIFWESERSVVRLSSDRARQEKQQRLSRIAEAAARQSGQSFLMQVEVVPSLVHGLGAIERSAEDTCLCAALLPQAQEPRRMPPPAGALHLVIGPEGDLSSREIELLARQQVQFISLGPHILRSETAAVVGIAMLQGVWGFR